MKVYIIGPSGSGKTYLGDILAKKLRLEHITLDYIFYKHVIDKNREEIREKDWKKTINKIIKKDDWVIEGVNPIREVIDTADKIIYLRSRLFTSLLNQWKRYFFDSKQRKEHGFTNNLKLSIYLFKQYLQNPDRTKMNDPKYSRVKKTDLILQNYTKKTILLKNREAVNIFIDSVLI